jgi:hypothetical protein
VYPQYNDNKKSVVYLLLGLKALKYILNTNIMWNICFANVFYMLVACLKIMTLKEVQVPKSDKI